MVGIKEEQNQLVFQYMDVDCQLWLETRSTELSILWQVYAVHITQADRLSHRDCQINGCELVKSPYYYSNICAHYLALLSTCHGIEKTSISEDIWHFQLLAKFHPGKITMQSSQWLIHLVTLMNTIKSNQHDCTMKKLEIIMFLPLYCGQAIHWTCMWRSLCHVWSALNSSRVWFACKKMWKVKSFCYLLMCLLSIAKQLGSHITTWRYLPVSILHWNPDILRAKLFSPKINLFVIIAYGTYFPKSGSFQSALIKVAFCSKDPLYQTGLCTGNLCSMQVLLDLDAFKI